MHLLTGLLFDDTGDRLCPTFCNRHGNRYCYYISRRVKHGGEKTGWRLPAERIEQIVEQAFVDLLRDRRQLLDWIDEADAAVGGTEAYFATADQLAAAWPTQAPGDKAEHLKSTLQRIDLRRDALQLDVDVEALLKRLSTGDEPSPGRTTATTAQRVASVTIPLTIRRRGQETRIVIEPSSSQTAQPDEKLVALIGRAHLYLDVLTDGSGLTLASLAKLTGVHIADISRALPLAFLSPMITKAILTGRQPSELTAREFARATEFPLLWSAQADTFGR